MLKPPPRRVGWWGKLPARGDFIGRGLPSRWRQEWDGWLQGGLALAAGGPDAATVQQRLRAFEPWRYLARTVAGELWCGVIAPSHDRVGRPFPLTLAECLDGRACPAASAARLSSLLGVAAQGPEALEAAIAALPPLAEPRSASGLALPAQPGSLWWPLAADPGVAGRAAGWPPEPALLLEVLGLQPAAHQIPTAE